MESVKPIPVVKPLSVNPLRASGPIRRTCGVIKLPVTWVAPPDDDQGGMNLNPLTPTEQKSQIHVIVQSLWEKRLFGVKPYDHMTGDEIAEKKVEVKPITPIVTKPHSPRNISPIPPFSHSPTSLTAGNGGGGGVTLPIKSAPSIIPASSFRHHHHHHQTLTGGGGGGGNMPPLLPTLLQTVPTAKMRDSHPTDAPPPVSTTPNYSVIQQTGQPIIVPQHTATTGPQSQLSPSPHQRLAVAPPSSHGRYSPTTSQFANGVTVSSSKPPVVPVAPLVTDRELQLQEERVRLLRQRLLAAAGGCNGQRPST